MASKTNISKELQDAFRALVSGEYSNFCLFSCFVNGEPAAAICAVSNDNGEFAISPIFVSITPGMELTDHDGRLA